MQFVFFIALGGLAAFAFYQSIGSADAAINAAPDDAGALPTALPPLFDGVSSFVSSIADMSSASGDQQSVYTPPAAAAPYLETINAAELRSGLPQGLLARVLFQESHFRPDIIDGTTRSKAGALGIAQFMPATAAGLGIDPLDPSQAIPAAAGDLRRMFDKFGSWSLALAAYNWGEGNLKRKGIDAAPDETRKYVAQITGDVGVM